MCLTAEESEAAALCFAKNLIGKNILDSHGHKCTVLGIDDKQIQIREENRLVKTIPAIDACRAFAKLHPISKRNAWPFAMKTAVVQFISDCEYNCNIVDMEKRNIETEIENKHAENELVEEFNKKEGDVSGIDCVEESRDKHARISLENQVIAADSRIERSRSINNDRSILKTFKTWKKRCEVLNDIFGCKSNTFSQRSVSSWFHGKRMGEYGGQSLFTPDVEEVLKYHVKILSDSLRPQSVNDIKHMLEESIQQPENNRPGTRVQISKSWVQRFLSRTLREDPQLCRAKTKESTKGLHKSYNSMNIDGWFDQTAKIAIANGFATSIESSEHELHWENRARVIITDETAIAGDYAKVKARQSRSKVVARRGVVDANTGFTRTERSFTDCPRHVTLLAGHNLLGEPTFPIFIVSSRNELTETKYKKFAASSSKWNRVSINDRQCSTVFITSSENGSTTQENICIIMKMIKAAFPDVANQKGKRVLWFTDNHGSRLKPEFFDELLKMGVVLRMWPPNCTSIMQSLDTTLFGPFKNLLEQKKEEYARHHRSKTLNEAAVIECAGLAYNEIFTTRNCLSAAKHTGMYPFNRQVHLESCTLGDSLYYNTVKVAYAKTLDKTARTLLESDLRLPSSCNDEKSVNEFLKRKEVEEICSEASPIYSRILEILSKLGPHSKKTSENHSNKNFLDNFFREGKKRCIDDMRRIENYKMDRLMWIENYLNDLESYVAFEKLNRAIEVRSYEYILSTAHEDPNIISVVEYFLSSLLRNNYNRPISGTNDFTLTPPELKLNSMSNSDKQPCVLNQNRMCLATMTQIADEVGANKRRRKSNKLRVAGVAEKASDPVNKIISEKPSLDKSRVLTYEDLSNEIRKKRKLQNHDIEWKKMLELRGITESCE